MKRYLMLLGATLACIGGLMCARPAHASALEYLDELAESLRPREHPSIAISVVGVDKDTKREFYIQGLEFEAFSTTITKQDLLDAINSKFSHSRMDNQSVVLDFHQDAKLKSRNGVLIKANGIDGSVTLPSNCLEQYTLSGHVSVGRIPQEPINNPADKVIVRREFTFVPLNSDGQIHRRELAIPDVKKVNSVVTVGELKRSAEEELKRIAPDYTILEVGSISVKHDDGSFTAIDDTKGLESSYTVRQREYKGFDSQDDELLSGNQDIINETYIIIRKDYLDANNQLKYKNVNVNYINEATQQLLFKTTHKLMPYEMHRIDFSDPYDYQTRNKVLQTSLDCHGISGYTILRRKDEVASDGTTQVNLYMVKRDPSLRPFDHAGYDNGASYEQAEEYAYLRDLKAPNHQENDKREPLESKPK